MPSPDSVWRPSVPARRAIRRLRRLELEGLTPNPAQSSPSGHLCGVGGTGQGSPALTPVGQLLVSAWGKQAPRSPALGAQRLISSGGEGGATLPSCVKSGRVLSTEEGTVREPTPPLLPGFVAFVPGINQASPCPEGLLIRW